MSRAFRFNGKPSACYREFFPDWRTAMKQFPGRFKPQASKPDFSRA